jgi:hypothetical protein
LTSALRTTAISQRFDAQGFSRAEVKRAMNFNRVRQEEMIRENASDGSYVVHSERDWCQQKVAIVLTTLLPGIRPVRF